MPRIRQSESESESEMPPSPLLPAAGAAPCAQLLDAPAPEPEAPEASAAFSWAKTS